MESSLGHSAACLHTRESANLVAAIIIRSQGTQQVRPEPFRSRFASGIGLSGLPSMAADLDWRRSLVKQTSSRTRTHISTYKLSGLTLAGTFAFWCTCLRAWLLWDCSRWD